MDNKPDQDIAAPDAEETSAPGRRLPLPKIGIIAGIIALQVVAAYFLQKALIFGTVSTAHEVRAESPKDELHKEGKSKSEKSKADKSKSHSAKRATEAKIVLLDEIIVNPAGTGGRRYLAVTLGLQINAVEAEAEIEEQRPVIRDALISLLSSLPLDQLASVQYRDSLKLSIRDTINKQLGHEMVDNVVFSNYVLQ